MSRRSSPALADRIDALRRASDALAPMLDQSGLDRTREVLARAGERRALSAEHTVIGLFGATGSGKSSLVNALVGQDIARAAVRRPTTSQPLAGIVGEDGANALLDWLEVPERHVLDGAGEDSPLLRALDGPARRGRGRDAGDTPHRPGVILLDLPDLDSYSEGNRAIARRMAGLVDVLVWVTDPQKYADAALHRDFVAPFAAHGAVTVAVLNQVDLLREADRPQVLASLGALLPAERGAQPEVFGVSSATGEGIDALAARLAEVARAGDASAERLRGDVVRSARELEGIAARGGLPAEVRASDARRLVDDLAVAARVPAIADAAAASYRHRAAGHVGWPVVRWMARLRPDPLRRLGITARSSGEGGGARTSLPAPDASSTARSSGALRSFAEWTLRPDGRGAAAPCPLWAEAVTSAARSHQSELPEALERAVAGADLRPARRVWWWRIIDVVQWLAFATAVAGLLWLTGLAVLAYFQVSLPEMPMVHGLWIPIPLPTALIICGVAVGILLGLLASGAVAMAASAERHRVRAAMRERVAETAQSLVVEPVEDVLDAARDIGDDLAVASAA